MNNAFAINEDNLLHYLASIKVEQMCHNHAEFSDWNEETEELTSQIQLIGKISIQPNGQQRNVLSTEDGTKIQLDSYPYNECEIVQCMVCNTVFFRYAELVAQKLQNRYKVIRKELIDIESLKPKRRIIIDIENHYYIIYKNPDLTYDLSISIPLYGGMDVDHCLTNTDKESYLLEGISSLKNRMSDMEAHYTQYKVTHWR